MACPTYEESRDYKVLKDTIYHEARGESREGQIGVAWVIINRANHPGSRWPNNIAGVCKQDQQFECWYISFHPFVQFFICSFVRFSFRQLIRLSNCPSLQLSDCSTILLSNCLTVSLSLFQLSDRPTVPLSFL